MKKFLLFLALSLALVAGVAAIYGRTGSYEYLSYDDEGYTTQCPFVRDGFSLSNAAASFKDPAWGGIYMPITYMTYAAVISACGTSPGPQHTLNAVLHAADSVLFFFFLMMVIGGWSSVNGEPSKVIGDRSTINGEPPMTNHQSPTTLLLAFLAAALWSWHALRVESVAWVASRKDLLFTMFTLFGLIAWMRLQGVTRVVTATALMILGCLSKPTAMVFPALAFALDIWRSLLMVGGWSSVKGKSPMTNHQSPITHYIPLAIVSVATAALAVYSQTNGTGEDAHALYMATFSWRCLNAAVSLGLYIFHFFVPVGLQFWYRPVRDGIPLHMWLGLSVFALSLAAYALALWRSRDKRLLIFSALWFAAAISPTLGIAGSFGNHAFADRFTYVPMMAASFLLMGFLMHLHRTTAGTPEITPGSCATAATHPIRLKFLHCPNATMLYCFNAAIFMLICASAFFAGRYCRTYETNLTAFVNVAKNDPKHNYAWKEIGSQTILRTGDVEKGIEYLRHSLSLFPDNDAREELAMALAMRNDPKDEAEIIDLCMRDAGPITSDGVIPILPVDKDKNGFKLEALGVIATRHRDWPNAIRCFDEAWKRGEREDCRMRLAMCHWNVKDYASAAPHLRALAQSSRPDISSKAKELLRSLPLTARARNKAN